MASAQQRALASDPGATGVVASVDASVRYFPTLPSFRLSAPEDDGTRLPTDGVRLPSPGRSTPMLGFGLGMAATYNDRWVIPLAAFDVSFGLGRAARVFTGADGSVVEMQPWRTTFVGGWAPGFGARWKHRRWMAQATLQPGLAALYMKVQLADGVERHEYSATALSLSLRATVEGCRRLDPETRVCLFVAPNVYEFGFINGGLAGLRWEIGP